MSLLDKIPLYAFVLALPSLFALNGFINYVFARRMQRNWWVGFKYFLKFPTDLTYQETCRYYGIVNLLTSLDLLLFSLAIYCIQHILNFSDEIYTFLLIAVGLVMLLETLVVTYRFGRKIITDEQILSTQILGSVPRTKGISFVKLLPSILLVLAGFVGAFLLIASSFSYIYFYLFTHELFTVYESKLLLSSAWVVANIGIFLIFLVLLKIAGGFLATLNLEKLQHFLYQDIKVHEPEDKRYQEFIARFSKKIKKLIHASLQPINWIVNSLGLEFEHITASQILINKLYVLLFLFLLFVNGIFFDNLLNLKDFSLPLSLSEKLWTYLLLSLVPFFIFSFPRKLKKFFSNHLKTKLLVLLFLGLSISLCVFVRLWYLDEQEKRNNQIVSMQISPTGVTVSEGETYRFFVLSYDQEDRQILPAHIDWQLESKHHIGHIDEKGTFTAARAGQGTIIARVGEIQASTTVKVEIDQSKWSTVETEHFKILYRAPLADQAEYAEAKIENIAKNVTTKMHIGYPETKTSLILTETWPEFTNVTGLGPEQALAVYYGNTIAVSPAAWNPDYYYEGDINLDINSDYATMILTHEYTHQINDFIEKGTLFSNFGVFPIERDLWFIEGLAEYIAFGFSEDDYWDIRDAIEYDYLLSWDEMKGMSVWDYPDYQLYLIYAEGYTVFEYLEEEFGMDKLQKYFQTISTGQNPNEALETVYEKSRSELEQGWRRWLLANYQDLDYRTFD